MHAGEVRLPAGRSRLGPRGGRLTRVASRAKLVEGRSSEGLAGTLGFPRLGDELLDHRCLGRRVRDKPGCASVQGSQLGKGVTLARCGRTAQVLTKQQVACPVLAAELDSMYVQGHRSSGCEVQPAWNSGLAMCCVAAQPKRLQLRRGWWIALDADLNVYDRLGGRRQLS